MQKDAKINEDTTWAELWMGDHPNGPSYFKVSESLEKIVEDKDFFEQYQGRYCGLNTLFELDP